MTIAFIGLGSTLASATLKPVQQLQTAKNAINDLASCQVKKCSSIYQSKALTLDDEPQDDYLNAVIQVETQLNPESLLNALQAIETEQGRIREKRWGARTIDLDILLYGDEIINTQRLHVPHLEMLNRDFVLMPLYQIDPNVQIANDSGNKTVKDIVSKFSETSLKLVGEFNGK